MKGVIENNKKPSVSVIIPTYKRPRMLDRAINSVLQQTYPNVEVIVVDDNDKDSKYRLETERCMEKYKGNSRVVYLKHTKNLNGSAARNTGIRYSKADYIAFLDDDDEFLPTKIEKQVEVLERLDNNWAGVYCGYSVLIRGRTIFESADLKEGNLKKDLLLMNIVFNAGSTLMVKRHVLNELGGFDESFERHQDWELLVRIFRKYKIAVVDEPLVRINRDTTTKKPDISKYVRTKEKYLSTFREDIEEFPCDIQRRIYQRHLYHVSLVYLKNRKIRKGVSKYRECSKFHPTSFEEKLKFTLTAIDAFFPVKERLKILMHSIKIHR